MGCSWIASGNLLRETCIQPRKMRHNKQAHYFDEWCACFFILIILGNVNQDQQSMGDSHKWSYPDKGCFQSTDSVNEKNLLPGRII